MNVIGTKILVEFSRAGEIVIINQLGFEIQYSILPDNVIGVERIFLDKENLPFETLKQKDTLNITFSNTVIVDSIMKPKEKSFSIPITSTPTLTMISTFKQTMKHQYSREEGLALKEFIFNSLMK